MIKAEAPQGKRLLEYLAAVRRAAERRFPGDVLLADAWHMGWIARRLGRPLSSASSGSEAWRAAWSAGWNDAGGAELFAVLLLSACNELHQSHDAATADVTAALRRHRELSGQTDLFPDPPGSEPTAPRRSRKAAAASH